MTAVFRKPTYNDIYQSWNTFERDTLKKGTLKTQVERAYIVCFTNEQKHVIVPSFSKRLTALN